MPVMSHYEAIYKHKFVLGVTVTVELSVGDAENADAVAEASLNELFGKLDDDFELVSLQPKDFSVAAPRPKLEKRTPEEIADAFRPGG